MQRHDVDFCMIMQFILRNLFNHHNCKTKIRIIWTTIIFTLWVCPVKGQKTEHFTRIFNECAIANDFFKNADPENLYRGFWEIIFFRGGGICADPDKSVIFIVTIQLIIFEIIGMPMLPFNAVKHKLRTS